MKLFNIPNIITLLNALAGFVGISFALKGNWRMAFYMVLLAAILDFFDGLAARLLNQKSSIGKELDSLADAISFGVLPGFIMFDLLFNSINLPRTVWVFDYFALNPIPYIAGLIPLFSILRLAKFNLDEEQSKNFKGLASPANAFLIASFSVCMHVFCKCDPFVKFLDSYQFLIGLTILSSILLISNIPMFSLKLSSLKWKDNAVQYIFLASSLVIFMLSFPHWYLALSLIIIYYILLSVFWKLVLKKEF